MGQIEEDLQGPDSILVETHISWVFLRRDDVIKVKKPVSLGFLDFSSLDARRAACEKEVALNRRLAPDVYLGVVPILRQRTGAHVVECDLNIDPDDAPTAAVVDWAVHMRRLPDEHRADHRLAAGTLTHESVERLADVLAVFHRGARSDADTAHYGEPEAIARNVDENFEQTRPILAQLLDPATAQELERWQRAFLQEQSSFFRERAAQGHCRDGHGDLRLEHVYIDDAGVIRVLDGIEFNDRFRFADVAADVAFFAMDLAANRRVDLSERFLARYGQSAQDYQLFRLVDFYESYRAFVRGKIGSIVAVSAATEERKQRALADARRFFLLSLAAERRSPLPPVVVVVFGLIGTGKSTLSRLLSRRLGAPVIDSDRTRKHLLGVRSTERLSDPEFSASYDPKVTHRVYDELLVRGADVLRSGRPVILDGSFSKVGYRAAAAMLAEQFQVPLLFLECRAPQEVIRARLAARARDPEEVSDGRNEIAGAFARDFDAPHELGGDQHLVVDTTEPAEAMLARLESRLPSWPAGLAG